MIFAHRVEKKKSHVSQVSIWMRLFMANSFVARQKNSPLQLHSSRRILPSIQLPDSKKCTSQYNARINLPKAPLPTPPIYVPLMKGLSSEITFISLPLFMLIFIQLIWPLIHLYIYLGGLAITLSFFHLSPTIIPASN